MNKELELTTTFTTKGVIDSDDGDLVISGTANASEKDRDGDIIVKEAWEQGALDHYVKNPIILAFHDHSRPIGKAIEYEVDNGGLHITASISKAAGDVYTLIKEGILKTFSIGFRVKDADYDSATDIFVIKDLELYEISVVSVPASPGSVFNVKKSLSDNELMEFKKEFEKEKAPKVEPISAIEPKTLKKETNNMSDKINKDSTVEALEQKLADMSAGLEILLDSQAKADQEKAEAKKEAEVLAASKAKVLADEVKEKEDAKAKAALTSVSEGTERLIADLEQKLADQETSVGSVIDELRNDLKEKSEEILSMQKSKMTFNDTSATGKTAPTDVIDTAVLLAKATGKAISETKFVKDLIEKAPYVLPNPGDHVGALDEDWETSFSTRMFDDIRQRLIIEPLFSTIQMNTASMHLPINPEAGVGEWISRADFETPAARAGSVLNGSTGAAQKHTLTDITLTAHKLAAKEYIGYEEEEDTILPIVQLVRDAIVRRVARSSDIAILRGDVGSAASAATDVYPFNGLATLATDAGSTTVSGGGEVYASRESVTVKDLSLTRQALGNWGLSPADVVYIVSPDTYYELLQDADFRTMDMVGTKATILTGQIGMVNGSPVIVSGEFAAAAADGVAGLAVNTSNFYVGTLRGLTTERDKDIIAQQNVIVATRRFDFKQIIATEAVAAVVYPSAT